MAGKSCFKNPPQRAGNKILADTEETIVGIPVIVKPIEIQLALVAVNIQFGNIAVAIGIRPDRTDKNRLQPSVALPFQCCRGCILSEILKSAGWKRQVFYFLNIIRHPGRPYLAWLFRPKNNALEFGRPEPWPRTDPPTVQFIF